VLYRKRASSAGDDGSTTLWRAFDKATWQVGIAEVICGSTLALARCSRITGYRKQHF